MPDELPIEYQLIKDTMALDLEVLDTQVEHFQDHIHVKILMRDGDGDEDEDEGSNVLESCAWGLIYVLSALSFTDARPRGISGVDFIEQDEWRVGDMLRHLRFERGGLHFYADYVRGRMMKTDIDIDKDGKITLKTVNRGEAATRWVTKLQGKKVIGLVSDNPPAVDGE